VKRDRVKIPYHVVRKVAVMASCDPRSVLGFCEGRTLRGSLATRIREAMVRLAIVPPFSEAGEKPDIEPKDPESEAT
jgi:predicted short-subunit dehydrogenase-like oxidoreductase (DUF2520 family)